MRELTEIPLLTEEGTEFDGVYQGFRVVVFDGQDRLLHRFELPDGTEGVLWGTTLLNGKLNGIAVGTAVRIARTTDKPSSKKGYSPMKQYRIWIED